MRAESPVEAEVYVDAAGVGAGMLHWEWEEKQMVSHVGCVGKQVGFGIEEASFVVQRSHDGTFRIHHHHRHHHPCPSPSP